MHPTDDGKMTSDIIVQIEGALDPRWKNEERLDRRFRFRYIETAAISDNSSKEILLYICNYFPCDQL